MTVSLATEAATASAPAFAAAASALFVDSAACCCTCANWCTERKVSDFCFFCCISRSCICVKVESVAVMARNGEALRIVVPCTWYMHSKLKTSGQGPDTVLVSLGNRYSFGRTAICDRLHSTCTLLQQSGLLQVCLCCLSAQHMFDISFQ